MAFAGGFASPADLLQALRSQESGQIEAARRCLAELFGRRIRRMIARATGGTASEAELDIWTERVLFWQSQLLRHLPFAEETRDWEQFCLGELVSLAVLLTDVFTPSSTPGLAPTPLVSLPPGCSHQVRCFARPLERVGGDWHVVEGGRDGALWVLVADVTGKGRGARLIAEAIPCLWQGPTLSLARTRDADPTTLLEMLDRELRDRLPLGVFIEAILARFGFQSLSIGWAGGIPAIYRPASAGRLTLLETASGWLGGPTPPRYPQQSFALQHGDEWALASDGLFDQVIAPGPPPQRFRAWLAGAEVPAEQGLYGFLMETWQSAQAHGQHDDATLVTVRVQRG